MAELAEEYSDSILHVTTRQDIQLHFVHLDDTPDLMRRLAVVGITTREACGNSVRNVTACQFAGVAYVSGAVVEYDPARPPGSRVTSVRLRDGTPIRDDVIYRVTVNDFLANGIGDGFAAFGKAVSQTATGVTDLDALIEYVRTLPQPIRAPTDTRMRAITQRN
jgi:2',3'-cyclic-nucleotide 2'-phosphodiesterase (5'-nucleotidase family)